MQNRTGADSSVCDDASKWSVNRSAAVVVAVTLQRLVENADRSWSLEESLVLDALRRSTSSLREASNEELADYIAALAPEQLRGVVSNVKGIYHELLFVHAENIDADNVAARVFETTNHPGADVEFFVDTDTIHSVQLKAVASPAAIFEHLARYPDIEVVVTEEVAAQLTGISSSGFFNTEMTVRVEDVLSELSSASITNEIANSAATSSLLAGAVAAAQILRSGQVSRKQFATAFGDVSVGLVTATALDALLEGLS